MPRVVQNLLCVRSVAASKDVSKPALPEAVKITANDGLCRFVLSDKAGLANGVYAMDTLLMQHLLGVT